MAAERPKRTNARAARPDDPVPGAPRAAGSPPPPQAGRHEGLVGNPPAPLGSDPRPGNVGHAAEAPVEQKDDRLDEADDESFPASDPPSWSAAPTTGEERPDPAGTPDRAKTVGLGRIVSERDRR